MRVVLDADVVIGALDGDDPHHTRAHALFRSWQQGRGPSDQALSTSPRCSSLPPPTGAGCAQREKQLPRSGCRFTNRASESASTPRAFVGPPDQSPGRLPSSHRPLHRRPDRILIEEVGPARCGSRGTHGRAAHPANSPRLTCGQQAPPRQLPDRVPSAWSSRAMAYPALIPLGALAEIPRPDPQIPATPGGENPLTRQITVSPCPLEAP